MSLRHHIIIVYYALPFTTLLSAACVVCRRSP